jgi:hypothetical protein
LPIIAERTYILKVSASGFKSVEGSCLIPTKVVAEKDISSTQTSITSNIGRRQMGTCPSIRVRFKDILGKKIFTVLDNFSIKKEHSQIQKE